MSLFLFHQVVEILFNALNQNLVQFELKPGVEVIVYVTQLTLGECAVKCVALVLLRLQTTPGELVCIRALTVWYVLLGYVGLIILRHCQWWKQRVLTTKSSSGIIMHQFVEVFKVQCKSSLWLN